MLIKLQGPVGSYKWPEVKGIPYKSPAVAGYEEKIRSLCQRAMIESGVAKMAGKIHLHIDIINMDVDGDLMQPIGVAKVVMDALTGLIYRDDRSVRTLSVFRSSEGDHTEIRVSLARERRRGRREKAFTDNVLSFNVPGTPICKGFPYSGSKGTVITLNESDLGEVVKKMEKIGPSQDAVEGFVHIDLDVISKSKLFWDLDNIARLYLGAARRAGIITSDMRITSIKVNVVDGCRSCTDEVQMFITPASALVNDTVMPEYEVEEVVAELSAASHTFDSSCIDMSLLYDLGIQARH